jgi:hypothetical protein
MKRLLIIFTAIFIWFNISAQSKTYWSSGGEMLFSFANISDNGTSGGSVLRWAPVINLQGTFNSDFNQNLGVFTGLAVRNVGYIYDNYHVRNTDGTFGEEYKKKFRSYNIAVPVGIKFGDLDNIFFYAGYEVELPFLYKEKTFDQGDKIDKITGWFSNRQEMFQHGIIAGVQFPYDFTLKFKYYFSEFHNQDFTDSEGKKPYSGLESHVMYFSLGYNFSWE